MYYLLILLVYGAVDAIACLGLSQQFGVAGVTNFGFIIFQAAGAYVAAVLALPADTANGGLQSYIRGAEPPVPRPPGFAGGGRPRGGAGPSPSLPAAAARGRLPRL